MTNKKSWKAVYESMNAPPDYDDAKIWEQGKGFTKLNDIKDNIEELVKQAKDSIKAEKIDEAQTFLNQINSEKDRVIKYARHLDSIGKNSSLYQSFIQDISDAVNEIKLPINEKELIKGGLADNKSLQDIADKHGVKLEDIQQEYEMGLKIEKEHTSDPKKAAEIAKDHLMENPKYYTELKKAKIDESTEAAPALDFGDDEEFVIQPDKVQEYLDEVQDMPVEDAVEYLNQLKSKVEKDLPKLQTKLGQYRGSYTPLQSSSSGYFSSLLNTIMKSGKSQKAATSSIGSVYAPFKDIDDAVNAFFMTDDERLEKLINYLQMISQAKITATDPTLKYDTKQRGSQQGQKSLGSNAHRRSMSSQLHGEFNRKPESTDAKSKGMKLGPFQRFDIMHGPIFGQNINDEQVGWNVLSKINEKINKGEEVSLDDMKAATKYFNGPVGKLIRFVLLHDSDPSVVNEQINKMIQEYHNASIKVNEMKDEVNSIDAAIKQLAAKPEEQLAESTLLKGYGDWRKFKKTNYKKK